MIIIVLFFLIIIFVLLAYTVFPVISGYGAKNMCSAYFLQHRDPATIIKEDLFFPISLGKFEIDEKDSSVTGSVLGLAKRKAIYRSATGATLINDFEESEVRKQVFIIPPPPSINSDSILWPVGNLDRGDNFPSFNKLALDTAIRSAEARAVLVVYDGRIIAEEYASGFDKNTVMPGWSMAKSITAAMIGLLVKEGKIVVDAPAPINEWKGTSKEKITTKQLLQQISGLDFSEVYFRPSNVNTMLWSRGDMAGYAASRPLKAEPGTVFNYSGGNTNILSGIIRDKVGEKDYAAFPYTNLFYKINAYSFLLEPDASGTYVGSSFCYATARDYARFGMLYYNNGQWNGEQVLPPGWVEESVQPSLGDKQKKYGYQFKLNGVDESGSKRMYPDSPADMYFADGFAGQNIFIIPSEKLVLVRLGMRDYDDNKFIREVIAATHQ